MPKKWITDRNEMEAILSECAVGSLATVSPDGAPYVVIVNYVYHNRRIYFHGALAGRKMDNITHNPRVCFEVHVLERIVRSSRSAEFGTRYRSVIVHGRTHKLTDPAAKLEALIALTRKYAGEHPFAPPTEKAVENTAVMEIEIDEMTGKRNVDST